MLSQWIHLGGVKAFLDGSLGSSSALFYEVSSEEYCLTTFAVLKYLYLVVIVVYLGCTEMLWCSPWLHCFILELRVRACPFATSLLHIICK
jgi:hypothetical protein